MANTSKRMTPAVREFPQISTSEVHPLSICIITFEAIGFWLNGGIATVSTGLAELLSDAGHHVTLALTRSDMLAPDAFDAASARYRKRGIEVVSLSRSSVAPLEGALEGFTAWERYAAYDWLKTRNFDIVHTSEHLGEAYYCIAAKKMGLAFARTQFWVGCHGPSAWVIEANEELAHDAFWIWTDAAERFVLREADLVWTPSSYLLEWMTSRSFDLPIARLFKQTYFIPDDLGHIRDRRRCSGIPTRELIFFGRLEPRKGIKLFISAVLALKGRLDDVAITFMGRQSTIDGISADAYISGQLDGSGLTWCLLDNFDRSAAYDYVVGPGRVAVLASPIDNSPCAIYELLEIGAQFIACAGGGIPELLDPSCHARVLFAYTVESLAARIAGLLDEIPTPPVAPPFLDRAETKAAWTAAHAEIYREISLQPAVEEKPKVTAVTLALIVDGTDLALEASIAAARWLGPLVDDLVLIVSDRRYVLPAHLYPDIRRLSLDKYSQAEILESLGRNGRPVIFLRSGALLTYEGCSRLTDAVQSVHVVVPFAFRNSSDGAVITEPLMAGDWSWTVLFGAAPVGAIISLAGLEILKNEREPQGSNPLIWIDVAVLAGLSVVTLAESLIDSTAVDRQRHNSADARARHIACALKLTPGQRLMVEVGTSALLRVPVDAPVQRVVRAPLLAGGRSSASASSLLQANDERVQQKGQTLSVQKAGKAVRDRKLHQLTRWIAGLVS